MLFEVPIRFRSFSFALLLGLLPIAQALAQPLPLFDQVRAGYVASDALLLDRQGEPLADVRLNPRVRRLDWVSLETLSPAMREALLAAEDKRFFEHSGVDWKAFVGAAWQNLWGGRARRGASTLTMQLAGLLEPELRLPSRGDRRRSLSQKWDQSLAAIELEKHWNKPQILEAYLNLAPFRGDLQGLDAASRILFGLPTKSLTRKEAVILAALLRGPNAKSALVAHRACQLAQKLGSTKLCPEITRLAEARLDAPRNQPRYTLAPHLARQFLHQPGQKIVTTLDANSQRGALQAVQRLQGADGSVLVLDNVSGEALVWVAAANGAQADGIIARRNIPNWWWPYAAQLSLERNVLTAATLLSDTPAINDASDTRVPINWYSLRTIMAQHMAGPMQQLLSDVGTDILGERLRALGLDVPTAEGADATGDTSLAQLAAAWHTLAGGGNYVPVRVVHTENGIHKVLRPEASFILLDMLSMQSALGWSAQWLSATADDRQAVLVGATDRYTIVAGVTSTPSLVAKAVAGKSSADLLVHQLWRDVATVLQTDASRAPAPPEGVVSDVVVFDPPLETARREWFVRGADTHAEHYKRF